MMKTPVVELCQIYMLDMLKLYIVLVYIPGHLGGMHAPSVVEVQFHQVNARTTYKKSDIFYIDPLSDLRLDLEAPGCRDFGYVLPLLIFQFFPSKPTTLR